jgi:hypothetical protein
VQLPAVYGVFEELKERHDLTRPERDSAIAQCLSQSSVVRRLQYIFVCLKRVAERRASQGSRRLMPPAAAAHSAALSIVNFISAGSSGGSCATALAAD